ncbi:MAG: toprim domain-containing protein [bacterium]|nr:toprim domain-containing protein [bacterium]
MDAIDKLTEIFKEFPGIGERQARRFVYFLMTRNGEHNNNFAKLIIELKKEIAQCKECFRFFHFLKNGQNDICELCSYENTDTNILMIVEKDSDLESVRKSRAYTGKYFILGGLVPIVEKNTKSKIRIQELKNRIQKMSNLAKLATTESTKNKNKEMLEIIMAFSLSPQGDHTDFYVRNEIKHICEQNNIKISSLGRGLSTGTELEYSDNDTLKNALKNRQ